MADTFKYRIIVIESLDEDAGDSLTGTHLFQNIITRLPSRFPVIEPSFFSVRSKEELREALDSINKITTPDDIVMIHLEAHGCEDGVTLSDKSTISWLELYDLIRPINLKISNRLILNLALCEGISLLGNIDIHQRAPFSIALYPLTEKWAGYSFKNGPPAGFCKYINYHLMYCYFRFDFLSFPEFV